LKHWQASEPGTALMQIIDAHQHFWDLDRNYLPWLKDAVPIPFRYGDYSALKRNYLPSDYLSDSGSFEVLGTVFVETEWDPRDPLGEVSWVEQLARRAGLPSVMVAQAWLDRADAPDILAAHARSPIVRGIRHKPRAAPNPEAMVPGAPGTMGDPAWRKGYSLLSPNGLSFDLQTPWWHLGEALALARDFPETQIIINHTGLPSDRSMAGLAGWRNAMELVSSAPNVAVKISGLGQAGQPWSMEANRSIVLDTIGFFGIERCMFASNFPVDSLVGSFETIYSGFAAMVADFPVADREALFHANAARIYRIPAAALGRSTQ
jgi:predicted TIM-barrel fold metal-dependent hydrolase